MDARFWDLLEANRTELQNYVCPRCHYLLRDAVQQMSCGHWMCECCAKDLSIETAPRCPLQDCQELWSDDGEPPYFPDRFVRKVLNKLAVKCINDGCGWKGKLEQLDQHLRECEFGDQLCNECKQRKKRFPDKAVRRYELPTRCFQDNTQQVYLEEHLNKFPPELEVKWVCPECHRRLYVSERREEMEENESFYTSAFQPAELKPAVYGEKVAEQVAHLVASDKQPCIFAGLGCTQTKMMTHDQMLDHLTTPDNLAFHMEIIGKFMKRLLTDTDEVEKDGLGGSMQPASFREALPHYKESFPKQFQLVEADGAAKGAVGGHYNTASRQGVLEQIYQERSWVPKLQQLLNSGEELESLQKMLMQKDAMITTLQEKLQSVEKLVQTNSSEGEDRDFRLSLIENSNFDGTMIWKIPQFSQRTEDARTGKYTSIFSLPYYSGRYGYKMCLRLYILGDGIGKGTHMSLFFVVMKGEFDAILQWPFTHKVSFRLINQRHGRDIVDVFQPDPLSSSFQRPKTDMNVASGCPRFISLTELNQGGFIMDNAIFIKVKVDTSTMKNP